MTKLVAFLTALALFVSPALAGTGNGDILEPNPGAKCLQLPDPCD